MKSFFLIIIFISSALVFGDCSPINLVTQVNSPFNKLPVYDQDGTNTCYAYTAAQLIDYENIKNGKPRSVHPIWAAIQASGIKPRVGGGFSSDAINAISNSNNCPYDVVSSTIRDWVIKTNANEVEILDMLERYSLAYEKTKNLDQSFHIALEGHKKYCSPNTHFEEMISELQKLAYISTPNLLKIILSEPCLKSSEQIPYWAERKDLKSNNILTDLMSKRLAGNHAPIGIGYCSEVLFKPSYTGIDRSTDEEAKDCGSHESIIVGQKQIGGKCHFLLRNSWGSSFGEWTKNWKCLCRNRASGEFIDDCTESKHNNGLYTVEGCWIESQALSKNATDITWIEK